KYITQNQPSFSSTSDLPYEVIHRSESGSGYSNSLCSFEHRRHRARAERTWNRRTRQVCRDKEPDELARIRELCVQLQWKRREPTSRPILTKLIAAGMLPAFPSQPTRLPLQNKTLVRFYSRKITFMRPPFINEGNSGNASGGRCFVSNDALDRGVACARGGLNGIRSAGAFRVLRSLLATAL